MADTRGRRPGAVAEDYSEQMLVCIQNCQDCHRACLQTLAYCMKQGGEHARPEHLPLLMDCADICLTAASFMIRGSDLHTHTCAACAAVCGRCAEECDAMSDDLRMKAVADTCRHCAESCGAMSRGVGMSHGADGATGRGARRTAPATEGVMSRRKTR